MGPKTPSNGLDSDGATSVHKYYLLIICTSYIICAANEFWVVNWFKEFGVNLPIYFALLQNGSWPVQLYIYNKECAELPEKRVWTYQMY